MRRVSMADAAERAIYALICSRDGVTAREIAREVGLPRKEVNRYLYVSPFVRDLCYHDEDFCWHGYIRQATPHDGLREFCGWYGYVREFCALEEDAWLDELVSGCRRIGRNVNYTRGLIHSFCDARETMRELFDALREFGVACDGWELAFELRIRRAKWVRIYADVLVIAPGYAFSLEFKMKDAIEQEEVDQAAKYAPYLEVVLGPSHEVVPALVLTRARELYTHATVTDATGEVPVASRDMLFNVFDEYLGFLA